jgi:7,8-dihydropterin-6-yl-methyl-4-(beta-D-ribofuranosyl)aminobenzene 5'-phosphate synthase
MRWKIGILVIIFISACQVPAWIESYSVQLIPATQVPETVMLTVTPFLPVTEPSPMAETQREEETVIANELKITIIYDNNEYNPELTTAWGFSALIEYRGEKLLFDTGGDLATLRSNMTKLGIDPTEIENIAISHGHQDHIGGLVGLLAETNNPTVYLIPSLVASYEHRISQDAQVIAVAPGQSLGEALFTTGEMKISVPEQALIIRTSMGLVIITGCAHPGIVAIVEQAQKLFEENIYFVMGGFHLGSKGTRELEGIIAAFRRLGVEKVAPCHCTGDRAIQMFKEAYGDDFIQAGVGKVIIIEE